MIRDRRLGYNEPMSFFKNVVRLGWVLGAVLLLGVACQTRVQHGLVEREANRMVAALRQAGVEASKVKEKGRGGKFAVEVPQGQVTRAIQILLQHELPRRRKPGFAEVFGKPSLVPTATEQRARYLHALSGELTRTLEAIGGVLEARVHLVIPQRHPLALKETRIEKPRAAVLIRARAGQPSITADEVRRLVAGSVQGLEAGQVAVVIRRTKQSQGKVMAAKLAQVGPVSVSAESRSTLQALLGGGLLLILALSGALVLLVVRLGRMRKQLPASTPGNDDEPGDATGTLGTDSYDRTT